MASNANTSRGTVPAKCVSCDRSMDSPLFCAHCRTLYPADDVSHFELFGLEPSYDLDPEVIRRTYLNLARAIHPDRFPRAAEEVERLSERVSARVNRAFQTLSDPVLRAEYLLEMLGGKSATQDKNVPAEVLSRTLMLREEIEEAKASDDQESIGRLRAQVGKLCEQTLAAVAELARRLPGDEKCRQALRAKLNSMKYYQKLLEQL